MVSDLSSQNTNECKILRDKFEECLKVKTFKKFFGGCADLEWAVHKCKLKEWEENRKKNSLKGKKKDE